MKIYFLALSVKFYFNLLLFDWATSTTAEHDSNVLAVANNERARVPEISSFGQ